MDKQPKILQLGKFFPVQGGVEKVMYDFTRLLSARGIDCDMMCANVEGGSSRTRLNDHAQIIGCRSLAKIAATMISPAMIWRLRRECKDYDIVHVHHPDPMACLALMLSGYKGKVVLHWHSDILKQHSMMAWYKVMQRWLLRRADLIVGTSPVYVEHSPWLADYRHKTTYLPIGIDPLEADPEAGAKVRALYPGKKIVFALGRLVEYKGFEYLVEAAADLPDDYMVLIGGEGPLEADLRGSIADKGLDGKVILLGHLTDLQVAACFAACDVFCFSSVQKTEAFGIVLLEAMSLGKPIVATDIPGSGVPWVNAHGVSGINVPPRDPKALSDAIQQICNSSQDQQRYSEGSLKRYREHFSSQQMISQLIDIYNEVLKA